MLPQDTGAGPTAGEVTALAATVRGLAAMAQALPVPPIVLDGWSSATAAEYAITALRIATGLRDAVATLGYAASAVER